MKNNDRYAELENTDINAVKVDEYTDGMRFSEFESVEDYLKQQMLDNKAAELQTTAIRLYGAKVCKNGNICLYGKDVLTDKFNVFFLSVPYLAAISPAGIVTVNVIKDEDGIPEGLELEETSEVLSDKLKGFRLVLVDGKAVKIKA